MNRQDKTVTLNLPNGDILEVDIPDVPDFIPDAMLVELVMGRPLTKGGYAK